MKMPATARRFRPLPAAARALGAAALAAQAAVALAQADLADRPPRTTQSVPANVLLALSVEWPTGSVQAYNDEAVNGCGGRWNGLSVCYFDPPRRAALTNAANAAAANWRPRASMPYQGYFDPFKCYAYNAAANYYEPVSATIGWDPTLPAEQQPAGSRARCTGAWSGNFLNWSTMHTIDLFRWAMTGGSRSAGLDTTAITVLEKAAHRGDGGYGQFPIKLIDAGLNGGTQPSDVAPVPPGQAQLYVRIQGLGSSMRFSDRNNVDTAGTTQSVRVRVCVSNPGGGVVREPNCKGYAPAFADNDPANDAGVDPDTITWKPTGLIQENAMAVRFSAFGYLLDGDPARDGGVMRARMKFVGPNQPARSAAGQIVNPATEWDRNTGIFVGNADPADAAATNARFGLGGGDAVVRSGVIQYLNEFGRRNGYKELDPVGELFYEGVRYYRNIGPTPEYSDMGLTGGSAGRKVDGFPVITAWDDPLAPPAGFAGPDLQDWCPKNFIIGIADSNSWNDKRLPGNTLVWGADSPAQPSNPDAAIDVSALLDEIIATERANEGVGLLNTAGNPLTPGIANFCCNGSAYVASLAYYANTRDIRPDAGALQTRGRQTVQTFYVDVREAGSWGTGVARTDPRRRNQFWLAAKYGGFPDLNTPPGAAGRLDIGDARADFNRDGRLDVRDAWDKDGDWLPDNYYEASTPEALVEGLRRAFADIRASIASAVGVGMSTGTVELGSDTGLDRKSVV